MYRYLLLAFFLVPLIEVWIFVSVGRQTGAGTLIALILATAVVGVTCLRWQGLDTLRRAQQLLDSGEVPALEMLEGAMLLVAGALLLTPGFFTDFIGFLFLWPSTRRRFARYCFGQLERRATMRGTATSEETIEFFYGDSAAQAHRKSRHAKPAKHSHETIEGEYTREK